MGSEGDSLAYQGVSKGVFGGSQVLYKEFQGVYDVIVGCIRVLPGGPEDVTGAFPGS